MPHSKAGHRSKLSPGRYMHVPISAQVTRSDHFQPLQACFWIPLILWTGKGFHGLETYSQNLEARLGLGFTNKP